MSTQKAIIAAARTVAGCDAPVQTSLSTAASNPAPVYSAIKSRGGTRLPMLTAGRKNAEANGAHSTYGYGHCGYESAPGLGPSTADLHWVRSAGVLAIPGAHGNYGESWHPPGAMRCEKSVFADLAAGESLNAHGDTSLPPRSRQQQCAAARRHRANAAFQAVRRCAVGRRRRVMLRAHNLTPRNASISGYGPADDGRAFKAFHTKMLLIKRHPAWHPAVLMTTADYGQSRRPDGAGAARRIWRAGGADGCGTGAHTDQCRCRSWPRQTPSKQIAEAAERESFPAGALAMTPVLK